jgi:hypothetical protein
LKGFLLYIKSAQDGDDWLYSRAGHITSAGQSITGQSAGFNATLMLPGVGGSSTLAV